MDVYLGTLVGTLVCHAYDSYVKRTSWSLINEGQAAQHHGCFKPFVCWYEGMAAPVAPAGKKYRVFPFGSRRYDDLDVRIVIARPDVSKGLGAAQSIYAM